MCAILRFANRICRFNFNFIFESCIWHSVFYPFQFVLLLLVHVIFHSCSQLYTHEHRTVLVCAHTLFVKVFHNCSNSLRGKRVRVHILVFTSFFPPLFAYFCLYIAFLPLLCVYLCVHSVLYSSACRICCYFTQFVYDINVNEDGDGDG